MQNVRRSARYAGSDAGVWIVADDQCLDKLLRRRASTIYCIIDDSLRFYEAGEGSTVGHSSASYIGCVQ
jgi:hypothetical protein